MWLTVGGLRFSWNDSTFSTFTDVENVTKITLINKSNKIIVLLYKFVSNFVATANVLHEKFRPFSEIVSKVQDLLCKLRPNLVSQFLKVCI